MNKKMLLFLSNVNDKGISEAVNRVKKSNNPNEWDFVINAILKCSNVNLINEIIMYSIELIMKAEGINLKWKSKIVGMSGETTTIRVNME